MGKGGGVGGAIDYAPSTLRHPSRNTALTGSMTSGSRTEAAALLPREQFH